MIIVFIRLQFLTVCFISTSPHKNYHSYLPIQLMCACAPLGPSQTAVSLSTLWQPILERQ